MWETPSGGSSVFSEVVSGLWAKTEPFHPLYCHMIDVGNVALSLVETQTFRGVPARFSGATGCSEIDSPSSLAYLLALHDIGKSHADFQAKGPDSLVEPLAAAGLSCIRRDKQFRHEALSAVWLFDFLFREKGWDPKAALTVSFAIRGHHGNFREDDPADEHETLKTQWEPLRRQLEGIVRDVFKPGDWRPSFTDHSTAGALLSGLLVLSDWIASNSELFCMAGEGVEPTKYAVLSRERARVAVAKLGFGTDVSWTARLFFHDIWPKIEKPRPIQARCEQLCREGLKPGLSIIEAPMGEGKTEAAIYLATQWLGAAGQGGIYVALPTAATSNQMFGRVKEFLEQHDPEAARGVRLVHGAAWLLDEASPENTPELSDAQPWEENLALDWFRPKKRSLLAAYGVGTIDQALMSVLHVKHGFLRLFGLAGKVLIIDEVHAYDAYMSKILTRLLEWCRDLGIPVILLSATLPLSKRQDLVGAYASGARVGVADGEDGARAPYPLLTFVDSDGTVREEAVSGSGKKLDLHVKKHPGLLENPAGIAQLVASRSINGGCFCVIANTVNSAQRIYRELKRVPAANPDDTVLLLFHARFPAKRRQEIEELALRLFDKRSLLEPGDPKRTERPRRAILVATQVVEQSLDLDFDEMFSEIAPIDLLLQRAGRLHRHDRKERPTGIEARFHILLPERGGRPVFGTGKKGVYDRFILLKTLAALEDASLWSLPHDIRSLVETVYDNRPEVEKGAGFVEQEDLDESWNECRRETATDAEKAKIYLVPMPSQDTFALARAATGAFDDDENDTTSYFNAKTRLGDETQRLLVLEGGQFAAYLGQKRSPPRQVLKDIFLKTVNAPNWWFTKVKADTGFSLPEKAPSWLPGVTVLRMADGCWRGRRPNGKSFAIRDDDELGLIREEAEGE